MRGSLDPAAVRSGVARGRFGLFQRRVRPRVFGEPEFEAELVVEDVEPARPHVIAYDAWGRMVAAAREDGLDTAVLQIHSAYRSVAFQRQIWEYRLEERRQTRRAEGLPALSEPDLRRLQQKWTAVPGASAHHTGFALDLKLYELGKRGSRRSEAYAWLAQNAVRFGFYPYLPEGWHWEYNPPGLVGQVRALREALASGAPFSHLLQCPEPIPIAEPAD